MVANIYLSRPGVFTITATTLRAETPASLIFEFGSVHNDYAARVRAVLLEHKHVGETALAYPAAKRLQTYLPIYPASTGRPIYAVRELIPAGTVRQFEGMMAMTMIRYQFMLELLKPALAANELLVEGIETNVEAALRGLFKANSVPDVFIPGDQEVRASERTEIDIMVEMGQATSRQPVEIPTPTQA